MTSIRKASGYKYVIASFENKHIAPMQAIILEFQHMHVTRKCASLHNFLKT